MIPWGRKGSIIHRAETAAADPDEVKALERLDGLRRQGRQDSKPIENVLAVRLDGFAPKGSWRACLSLQDEDRNTALRECQAQGRPATPRPHHYDVELPCQPYAPKPCGRSIGGRLLICNERTPPGLPFTGTTCLKPGISSEFTIG